jgi:hypothetical protein
VHGQSDAIDPKAIAPHQSHALSPRRRWLQGKEMHIEAPSQLTDMPHRFRIGQSGKGTRPVGFFDGIEERLVELR